MVGQGPGCGGDCAEGFPLGFPSPPHPAAGLSTPFWKFPSLEAPISASPQGPHPVQPPPCPQLLLGVCLSPCISYRLYPPSFYFLSLCSSLRAPLCPPGPLWVCLWFSHLPLCCPKKIPCANSGPPPTPAIRPPPTYPSPSAGGPAPQATITHRWGPRTPSSTEPATRPAGPCPSSGQRASSAKLSSEVAGHTEGEGAGPGCPRPSPQLRAPRLWLCPPGTGRAPHQLHSTPWPPSLLPDLLLPPRPPKPVPPPLPPPASTHRAGSRGGHWDFEGLTSERRGEDQPCLKGTPEGG